MFSANGETTLWNEDGSWTTGPSLPMFLMNHCVVQYDSVTSYLVGGYSKTLNITYDHLYIYDWVADTWTKKASMANPRLGIK
jgi:hypothetical protein